MLAVQVKYFSVLVSKQYSLHIVSVLIRVCIDEISLVYDNCKNLFKLLVGFTVFIHNILNYIIMCIHVGTQEH